MQSGVSIHCALKLLSLNPHKINFVKLARIEIINTREDPSRGGREKGLIWECIQYPHWICEMKSIGSRGFQGLIG